jgi:hypothetical protein
VLLILLFAAAFAYAQKPLNTGTQSGSGGLPTDISGVVRANGGAPATSAVASDITGALGFTPVNKTGDTVTGILNIFKGVHKGPRVDVTHPDFGALCSNPADPSGANDSTCAINAAVAWAKTLDGNGVVPSVYFPTGSYKISSALRLPCQMHYYGDGPNATRIIQTTNNQNGVTIYEPAGIATDSFLCSGSFNDIEITSLGSHLHTGTLLEVDQTPGFKLYRVKLFNSGGRGLTLNGDVERMESNDLQIDAVRKPITFFSNINEDEFYKTNIDNPGVTNDGYNFNVNAVNGQYPIAGLTVAQVPSAATCNGTQCTFTVTGGNAAGTLGNGRSPIIAGQWFQIQGVADLTALNGYWQVASYTNNVASNQYQITFNNAVSGSSTMAGATFKPALIPDHHCAITLTGTRVEFVGGSVKSLQYLCGIDVWYGEAAKISEFYIEGYPTNGMPVPNSAIELGGLAASSTLASAMTSSSTTLAMTTTTWWPGVYTDPQDVGTGCQMYVMIEPQDFQWGNTTASAYVSGVQRGQYELACISGIDGNNTMYLSSRNATNDQSYSSTAPANTAWPAGSVVVQVHDIHSYGTSGTLIDSDHINTVNTPSPTGNWTSVCNDTNQYLCSEIVSGPIEDGISVAPPGVSGTGITNGSGVTSLFVNDSFYQSYPFSVTELYGQSFIKVTSSSTLTTIESGFPGARAGETSEINNGSLWANSQGPQVQVVQYTGGSAIIAYADPSRGLFYTNSNNGTYPNYVSKVAGYSPAVTGPNPGGNAAFGDQFNGTYCWFDTPTSSLTHSTLRFCYKGGSALTGTSTGLEIAVWNTTTSQWVVAYSVFPDGTNPLTADVNITGNIQVSGSASGAAFANMAQLSAFNYFSQGLGVQGVSVGNLSNMVSYSYNFSATGWHSTSGTAPTMTTGQTDAFGGSTATLFATASGTNQWAYTNAANPTTGGNYYNVSAWVRGATGTETYCLGVNQTCGPITTASTTPQYKTFLVQSNGSQPWNDWILQTTSAESIYLSGVSVTAVGNNAAYLPTNGTAVDTPAPAVAIGNLGGQFITNANEGVATLLNGTVTVNSSAALAVGTAIYTLNNCGNSGSAIGVPSLGTVTVGTSFVINSISATNTIVTGDNSKVCWFIH